MTGRIVFPSFIFIVLLLCSIHCMPSLYEFIDSIHCMPSLYEFIDAIMLPRSKALYNIGAPLFVTKRCHHTSLLPLLALTISLDVYRSWYHGQLQHVTTKTCASPFFFVGESSWWHFTLE